MLDINLIRENPILSARRCKTARWTLSPVDSILQLDEKRRALLTQVEALKAERNAVSKEIGKMKDRRRAPGKRSKPCVTSAIRSPRSTRRWPKSKLNSNALTATLPNIPDARTPYGKDDSENVVIRTIGEPQKFDFTPKAALGPWPGARHHRLRARHQDHRFALLRPERRGRAPAARPDRLDARPAHPRQGYREKYLPFMVKTATVYGAGQLPKFADNLYKDHEEDFYFVPTAEVPLTGLHMDEILDEASLPLLYTAYTPCFRREKMSAGRDVRGIKRGHQFDKVEMYIYCKPEEFGSPAPENARGCRRNLRRAGSHLSRQAALHRRYRLRRDHDLRSRSLGARL